ncbi:hypothetical protein AMJ87_04710 [candidate division WOR_3 bacterium SM23_60]|uniref:Outer membrane protein beta-barrel domain-containing protein n=1 Tax=candidate division WOR_3 bacterium SM23_60 TaxID=1703780 RepID=A0A0S8GHE8_UNCW3|nr:MAG: hypothetical protein AMJ87_04710 [candidate division WOR_3 bacterium SM23_60]
MSRIRLKANVWLFFLLIFSSAFAGPIQRFELNVESGIAFVSYSDIQIPKSTGTLISFSDELETDPAFFVRGRFAYYFNRGNMISVLVAPLTLRATGSVDREVVFEGESFAPNATLNTVYKFNSYRLTYEHFWFAGDGLRLGLGITAKIRDAAISIADSIKTSEKTDLGFVPLIKFSFAWRFMEPLVLVLDGDALAAPQGRAEDISLALQGDSSDRLSLKLGYRVLEGGSDVEEVYSFTWVNYLFGGFSLRF